MKKKNNNKEDKIIKVLIILFIIIAVFLIIISYINRNKLSTDNKVVVELHNYFNTEDLSICEGLFNYSDKKVSYKSINSETRLCIAYQKAHIDDGVEIEKIKKSENKNTCKKDKMIFRAEDNAKNCVVNKIKKEIIDNSYKKLFGHEIEDNEEFRIDNLNICYLKDEYYYCGLSETFTYVLGSETKIYRVIDKAVEKSGVITIYDYFIKINEGKCYSNYTTLNINNNCTSNYKNNKVNYKFMKKYGTLYKHIFKESKNNVYYWVSSEPIKEE